MKALVADAWDFQSLADAYELPEETRRRLGFAMDYNGALGIYDPRVLL